MLTLQNEGAVIKTSVEGSACTVRIGAGSPSSVMGEYNSETRTGRFDGQFKYMASGLGCFGVGEQSLAQFEAEVKANNNLEILP